MDEKEMARKCVEAIRAQMRGQGINASGRTSDSLGFDAEPGKVVIFAEGEHAPIMTLQKGAGPHVNPYPLGFDEAIREWVAIRFGNEDEDEQDRIAGAVAWKIRREGTELYRETRESGIPRDVFTPALTALIEDFKELAAKRMAEVVGQAIDRMKI